MKSILNKIILSSFIWFNFSCGPGFYINKKKETNTETLSENGGDSNPIVSQCGYEDLVNQALFSFSLDQSSKKSGNKLIDASGSNEQFSLISDNFMANKSTLGKYGNGLDFDGLDDFLLQDNTYQSRASDPTTTDALTFSFWFKHDGTLGAGDMQTFIASGVAGVSNSFHFWINGDSALYPGNFTVKAVSSSSTPAPLNFPYAGYLDNKWHLVVITKTNSTGITVYLDNEEVAQDSGMANNNYSTINQLKFGYDGTNINTALDGQMDEINFWGRALTSAERGSLFECAPK